LSENFRAIAFNLFGVIKKNLEGGGESATGFLLDKKTWSDDASTTYLLSENLKHFNWCNQI